MAWQTALEAPAPTVGAHGGMLVTATFVAAVGAEIETTSVVAASCAGGQGAPHDR